MTCKYTIKVRPIVVKLSGLIYRDNELGEQIEKKARKRKNRIKRKRGRERNKNMRD